MILAFDTYYLHDKAKTVCLSFNHWNDSAPYKIFSEIKDNIADYIPGEFYKRELPCILSLLQQIDSKNIDAIIIDGYVYLDDEAKLGLGGHLYYAVEKKFPIIGVAKTNFATINKLKCSLLRGESKKPLFITAIGVDIETAAHHILTMSGNFRIPTLLKTLDMQTRTPM